MISFETRNKEEARAISRIAQRAVLMAEKHGVSYAFMDADMDLTAAHCNGCRLDLGRLAAADDFNFAHDVFGIRRHLNRETGKLENCFMPRYAEKE